MESILVNVRLGKSEQCRVANFFHSFGLALRAYSVRVRRPVWGRLLDSVRFLVWLSFSCTCRCVGCGWLVWVGWIPAPCSDVRPAAPLQCSSKRRLGLPVGIPVLPTYEDSTVSVLSSCIRPSLGLPCKGGRGGANLEAPPVFHSASVLYRAATVGFGGMLDLKDAAHLEGTGPPASICPNKNAFLRELRTTAALVSGRRPDLWVVVPRASRRRRGMLPG